MATPARRHSDEGRQRKNWSRLSPVGHLQYRGYSQAEARNVDTITLPTNRREREGPGETPSTRQSQCLGGASDSRTDPHIGCKPRMTMIRCRLPSRLWHSLLRVEHARYRTPQDALLTPCATATPPLPHSPNDPYSESLHGLMIAREIRSQFGSKGVEVAKRESMHASSDVISSHTGWDRSSYSQLRLAVTRVGELVSRFRATH